MNALSPIAFLINHRWWKYRWRYLLGQTPWETDETPAEVLEFIARNLARLLRPGAWFMLYAWLPWMNHEKPRGISPETVEKPVWSMQSATLNPSSEQKLIEAKIRTVIERLKYPQLLGGH
jgi:hypothetical protein